MTAAASRPGIDDGWVLGGAIVVAHPFKGSLPCWKLQDV